MISFQEDVCGHSYSVVFTNSWGIVVFPVASFSQFSEFNARNYTKTHLYKCYRGSSVINYWGKVFIVFLAG